MVGETNQENVIQCCSKCGEHKNPDRIVKNRKVCKDCCNKRKKEKYNNIVIDATIQKTCIVCNITKSSTLFITRRNMCKDCNNIKRKQIYQDKEEIREHIKAESIKYKQRKKAAINEIKRIEQEKLEEEIGQENTICKYCKNIKSKDRFRYNRLKCKDCERDEPLDKFKRYIRTRIYNSLKRNKCKHANEYLGCNIIDYQKWILYNTNDYTIENYGKIWHIDHIIPLSKFNFENPEEQLLAFNWRNTMPLLAKENLSKNNKILQPQIEQHLKTLINYHKENNLILPKIYIDLFAKYLEAGNPLEP
jgi:hypothetical protein